MLYICKGLPASGKDTYANEMIDKSGGSLKRVNKDMLREMIDNNKWSGHREKNILKIRDVLVNTFLNDGYDVIVTDTNLHPKHIERLSAIAKDYNSQVKIIDHFLKVSPRECVLRDAARGDRSVGSKVIYDMYFKYVFDSLPFEDLKINEKDNVIICDIDGTLAFHNTRNPYDLTKVSEDSFNQKLWRSIAPFGTLNSKYVFVSGREGTRQCKSDTIKWIEDNTVLDSTNYYLFMREERDARNDAVVKEEIYEKYIKDKFNVMVVFDDRDRVVDMWRSKGLLCCQVNYGGF